MYFNNFNNIVILLYAQINCETMAGCTCTCAPATIVFGQCVHVHKLSSTFPSVDLLPNSANGAYTCVHATIVFAQNLHVRISNSTCPHN